MLRTRTTLERRGSHICAANHQYSTSHRKINPRIQKSNLYAVKQRAESEVPSRFDAELKSACLTSALALLVAAPWVIPSVVVAEEVSLSSLFGSAGLLGSPSSAPSPPPAPPLVQSEVVESAAPVATEDTSLKTDGISADEVEDTAEDVKEAMLEAADMLSSHAEELLEIRIGRSTLQIVEVANKMYEDAMDLAVEAKALSNYELPDEQKKLILQISEAARLVSAIAQDIALKEQARLGQTIVQQATSTFAP